MMSRETRERIRRMTTTERLRLVLDMMRAETRYLLQGSPDLVDRRFELLRRQNDLRNRRMLEGIAHTRERS
jgi:hypothetical protein